MNEFDVVQIKAISISSELMRTLMHGQVVESMQHVAELDNLTEQMARLKEEEREDG